MTDLELTSGGGIAWIAKVGDPGDVRQVFKLDKTGRRKLDDSVDIGLKSLRIDGSRASWLKGAATGTATLTGHITLK